MTDLYPNPLDAPTDFIAITFEKIGVRVVEAPDAAKAIEAVRHLSPVSYTRLRLREYNTWAATGDLPTR